MAMLLAILLALLLDKLLGEPPVWLHPVVGMGKLLGMIGRKIAPRIEKHNDWPRFLMGAAAWLFLASVFGAVYIALQWMIGNVSLSQPWWLEGIMLGVLLKPLLSWRMLHDEVSAVHAALQQSLQAGRERLSWLVSRDTSTLDAGTVRESVIETLAENLSDSVVAPLFWFAIAGLPGAALYRFANTADAMWGYPGWRGHGPECRYWQWAGKWAARTDDILNWIPARITAVMLVTVAPRGVALTQLLHDATVTPSPNGGWPMGAMAQILGVRLGKPGIYVLNPHGCVPQGIHVQLALTIAARAVYLLVISVVVVMTLMIGIVHA